MKKNKFRGNLSISSFNGLTLIFLLLTLNFCFSTTANAAHRYHTSLTRMDYNTAEKLVEVTIQLFTHDLTPTLEKRAKKNIDLEKTPEANQLIFEYLSETFILKDRKNREIKAKWVGKELETDIVYIYIEFPFAEGLDGTSLQNTIFFKDFPEQTNLVSCRFDGKKADLLFKVGDNFKEIFPTLPAEKDNS